MADAENPTVQYLQVGLGPQGGDGLAIGANLLGPNGRTLKSWPGAQEPAYKYVFAVKITNIDPTNLTCEIRRKAAMVTKQADLTDAHFTDVMSTGIQVPAQGLDLAMHTDEPSLVMLSLAQNGVTFNDPLHLGEVEHVILRRAWQLHMIYQPRWLTRMTDKKTISVILREHRDNDYPISYALKVRVEDGTSVTNMDVDPKIENQGET